MESNITVIDEIRGETSAARIFQWECLEGSNNTETARTLYFARQVGMHLRQVVLYVNNAGVTIEPGALYFMKGNVNVEVKAGGLGGLAKKLVSSALTNETTFRPRYFGTGEIYLEPSFGHYLLVQINEETIVDKGLYYASQDTVEVGVAMQKNISSGVAGGEGWFQTKLTGSGWCVLTSPVPISEIMKITLNNEKLSVDGNFALLRKGKIDFRVEKSARSILGTMRSGEGLLQTFTGTGEVWLAPTQAVYERLTYQTLSQLGQASQNSMGTKV